MNTKSVWMESIYAIVGLSWTTTFCTIALSCGWKWQLKMPEKTIKCAMCLPIDYFEEIWTSWHNCYRGLKSLKWHLLYPETFENNTTFTTCLRPLLKHHSSHLHVWDKETCVSSNRCPDGANTNSSSCSSHNMLYHLYIFIFLRDFRPEKMLSACLSPNRPSQRSLNHVMALRTLIRPSRPCRETVLSLATSRTAIVSTKSLWLRSVDKCQS